MHRRHRGPDRRRDQHRRSPTRVDITVRQPAAAALQLRSPETLAQQVLEDVAMSVAAEPMTHDVAPWRQPAACRPTAGSAADVGPGGSTNPDDWPALWSANESRLEPLSRALASTLRHNRAVDGCLTIEESQLLAGGDCGTPWTVGDVLLIGAMSCRTGGQPRFQVYADDTGERTIEAVPKEATAGAEPRRTTGRGGPAATKEQLDAELDGWKMEVQPGAPASSSGGPPTQVQAKTKRPRGSRGNPNRPSQVARAARIAAEK